MRYFFKNHITILSYQINSQISREITGAYKSEIFVKNRMKQMLNFFYKFAKILLGLVGFPKSYVIFRVGHDKCLRLLTSAYKVGGWGEKRPKICLRNI